MSVIQLAGQCVVLNYKTETKNSQIDRNINKRRCGVGGADVSENYESHEVIW